MRLRSSTREAVAGSACVNRFSASPMISNSRSTALRNWRSVSYSEKVRPSHHSLMLRPDTSTSNSSFFARLSIDELTCGLDFTPEVGVANGLFSDEINMASEKTLEFLSKPEVSVRVESRRLPIRHLDDEVEIARRLNEPPGCGRAEEIEAFNAVPSAKFGELA